MRPARATSRGFTLLEMLVVMVLLGLLSALALPAMQRWHDAVQVRARATGIVEALRAAAFAAGANRSELVMDEASFRVVKKDADRPPPRPVDLAASEPADPVADGGLRIDLPEGWRVERVAPARFMANGLCQGGSASFQTERGERLEVQVAGPICRAELVTGRDAP